jgi:hypothetical protein
MPEVLPPEQLSEQELAELAKKYPDKVAAWNFADRGAPGAALDRINLQPQAPVQHIWFRVAGELGDDPDATRPCWPTSRLWPAGYRTVSAPDFTPQQTHPEASLIALWFHRAFRMDEPVIQLEAQQQWGSASRGSFIPRGHTGGVVAQERCCTRALVDHRPHLRAQLNQPKAGAAAQMGYRSVIGPAAQGCRCSLICPTTALSPGSE